MSWWRSYWRSVCGLPPRQWQEHYEAREVTGMDCNPLAGRMLRRVVNGEAQYRAISEKEIADADEDRLHFDAPP